MNISNHIAATAKAPAARAVATPPDPSQPDFVLTPPASDDASQAASMALPKDAVLPKPGLPDVAAASGKADPAKPEDTDTDSDAAAGWLALLAGIPPAQPPAANAATNATAKGDVPTATAAVAVSAAPLPPPMAAVAAKQGADAEAGDSALPPGLLPTRTETASSSTLGAAVSALTGGATRKTDADSAMAGGKDFQSFDAWLQKADAVAATAAPAPAPAANGSATATPVTLTIPTPVNHSGWSEALGHHVLWSVNQGVQQVQIQLHPTELGPISVHLRVEQDQAQVAFSAAHAHTREALEQALPRLREMFAQEGITLGQANVQAQTQTPQQHSGGHTGNSDAGTARNHWSSPADARGDGGASVSVVPVRQRLGLVDDYV